MRNEYPRPDFVRKEWSSLNGVWRFREGGDSSDFLSIEVPFVPQSQKSGIGKNLKTNEIIYDRFFEIPDNWAGKRIILHFGAVDYECEVWVNGKCAGRHTGGHTSFQFDITDLLSGGKEHLKVVVLDWNYDEYIPRGKQTWQEKSEFIWYTRSSGIWQSVWIEPVDPVHIEWMHFTPDIDRGTVEITYQLSAHTPFPYKIAIEICFGKEEVYKSVITGRNRRGKIIADVFEGKALRGAFQFTGWYWSPEHPALFDVVTELLTEDVCRDRVSSYFGMRKIHVQDGKIYLNNQPYYQKLILDQGYWKETLMTAPSEQDFIDDIEKAKAMGFNGCRKHEKVEDPVFLYWADRLGFLVWESMPSFWNFSTSSAAAFTQQWGDVIHRDYNHPCIVVWNMLNESWGVPRLYDDVQQQHFARSLYHMAHGQDPTRLVIANDGWELTENDICAFHTYKHGEEKDLLQQKIFKEGLKTLEGMRQLVEKSLFAKGFDYDGQPIMLTEIGGISMNSADGGEKDSWGYTGADDTDSFLRTYERLIDCIYDSDLVCGFCYTQLSDIEQEKNGLLDEDHQYKVKAEAIRLINSKKPTTGTFSL